MRASEVFFRDPTEEFYSSARERVPQSEKREVRVTYFRPCAAHAVIQQ